MSTNKDIQGLRQRLASHALLLQQVQADGMSYLTALQDRHEQLTCRLERLDRQVDGIVNPDSDKSRPLVSTWEQLSASHSHQEELLDDLENLVLEPLREAQEILRRLVS